MFRFRPRPTASTLAAALACGSTALAAPSNLAPAGTASADSTAWGGLIEYANDGNRDGDFANNSVWHSDDAGDAWWEVNLGAEYVLDRVQIFNRTDAGRFPWWDNFRIEVYDAADNIVFNQSYLVAGGGTDWPWGTNGIRNVVGQRVRIITNDPALSAMAEFEVYGQTTPIATNLALGATITGQTAAFGSALSDLNDGDIDGNFWHGSVYHSDLTGSNQFVQLDLGSVNALDYITVYSRTDEGTTGPIRISVLDESLAEVFSADIDMTAAPFGYDFTTIVGGIEGRYVRVAPTTEQNFALAEIEVFGVVPEPATLSLAVLGLFIAGQRRRIA